MTAALRLEGATLRFGSRTLWEGLDLSVQPGEFLAVLGGNGSGKTSLLRAVLGLQGLTAGRVQVGGHPVGRGTMAVGYVPQHRRVDPLTPLRAKDLVRCGLDGHRWGPGSPRRIDWARIDAALALVDASDFADAPVGSLSGGQQQRVRIAQALVHEPEVLLCDEPLLSLDPPAQTMVTDLIARITRERAMATVFVTHEIGPVAGHVDRVLYLAGGRFRVGSVDEVLTTEVLSDLYRAPVEVIRTRGRILVAGVPTDPHPIPAEPVP